MALDPLEQLVANRRSDLLTDARRHALARSVRSRRPVTARLRTTTARLLFAAAARLGAHGRPTPCTSS